jgi:hypothetical protein
LVEKQIDAGQKLIERLNEEGIPVLAGGWIKESESRQWYLYLVTPLVGEDGATKPAYHRIIPVVRQLQGEGFWLDPFEIKVIGPTDPIAEAVIAVHRRLPRGSPTRYHGASLGGLSIEAAYLYPSIVGARQ